MQFALIGLDASDETAMARRMAAREAHLELGKAMQEQKRLLYACALLDDHDKMVGSIMVVDFPTREDLDNWLKIEPYVVGQVWQKVEIRPCKVGPSFVQK